MPKKTHKRYRRGKKHTRRHRRGGVEPFNTNISDIIGNDESQGSLHISDLDVGTPIDDEVSMIHDQGEQHFLDEVDDNNTTFSSISNNTNNGMNLGFISPTGSFDEGMTDQETLTPMTDNEDGLTDDEDTVSLFGGKRTRHRRRKTNKSRKTKKNRRSHKKKYGGYTYNKKTTSK